MNAKWQEYRPSKTLWFWSCAACVALTMIGGFTFGGWVTAGTASEMAESSREEGRAQLAAGICVEKFKQDTNFAATLADLKAENSWSRDDFVTDGGWVTLTGMKEPVDGAADLCAETLADMEAPEPAATTADVALPAKS